MTMIKRFIILFVCAFTSFMWSTAVFAEEATSAATTPSGLTEEQIKGKIDAILPSRSDVLTGEKKTIDLPSKNFKKEIIPSVIKMILTLTGVVTIVVFVYAGAMLIYAQGNEEEITKFKNIIIWSLVGLAFVMAAYAIVTGVMQLVFK